MLLKYENLMLSAGRILDLYCVRLSKAAPICKNFTKLYFDAIHLEKGFNRRVGVGVGGGGLKFWCPFFKKNKKKILANFPFSTDSPKPPSPVIAKIC